MATAPEWGPPVDGFPGLKQRLKTGVWYIVRTVEGKKKKRSLGTKDEGEAKQRYVALNGSTPLHNPNLRCDDTWKQFIERSGREEGTIDRYQSVWKNYAQPILGRMFPRDVTPEDIVRVYDRALATGQVRSGSEGKDLSVSSIEKIEIALSAHFTACSEVPLRCIEPNANPVKLARKELRRKLDERAIQNGLYEAEDDMDTVDKVLTDAEVDAISEQMTPTKPWQYEVVLAEQLRVLTLVSPEIGWRISEALGTMVSDFRPSLSVVGDARSRPATIRIVRQVRRNRKLADQSTWTKPVKGDKATVDSKRRVVPVSPFAARVLQAYINKGIAEGWLQPNGLLFPTPKGTPRRGGDISEKISQAAVKAGIERRITSHYFRHTFASRQYARGTSIEHIALAMGDTVEIVKKTYLHLVEQEDRFEQIAAAGRQ